MKILFIQKEGGIFGAENFQLKIIPALLDEGIEIEFLRLYTDYQGGKGGDFINRLHQLEVKTHEIDIGKLPKFSNLRKIKNLAKTGRFDLVHTHLIHADLHLSFIKLFLGGIACPWISTKHGYDNTFTAKYGFDATKQGITLYYLLCKLSERLCDKSYTISHGLRNFFRATGATKVDKMDLIHYGFDLPDTSDNLLDTDFKRYIQQIVIAGRLVGFKGHEYLIKAMSEIAKKSADIGLVVVGSGELEQKLRDQVKQLKLQEQVHFTGYSKEVTKWMYNSDLVLVPSISEGFGVVFLEAFNCKKPVISWDVPAGSELMKHDISGFLVKPYDTAALANQIVEVFARTDHAKKVAEQAFVNLKTYYTLERMTKETINLYKAQLK